MPATAAELYACIDEVSAQGVLDLLASGAPAVDTSQPVYTSWDYELLESVPGYSCPIQCTLHALTQVCLARLAAAAAQQPCGLFTS